MEPDTDMFIENKNVRMDCLIPNIFLNIFYPAMYDFPPKSPMQTRGEKFLTVTDTDMFIEKENVLFEELSCIILKKKSRLNYCAF